MESFMMSLNMMPPELCCNRCFGRGHFVRLFVIDCLLSGGLGTMAQEQQPVPGFRDRTAELGLQPANSKACWVDFNGDGFVDVHVGGYEDWDAGITYPDLLLLNENGKSFRLAWSEVRYRARGVTACDFNQDGDLDVYVSNYRLQPNVLWLNDGKGQFKDVTAAHNAVGTSPLFDGGHSIGARYATATRRDRRRLFQLIGQSQVIDNQPVLPVAEDLVHAGDGSGKV